MRNQDFADLVELRNHRGYQLLQLSWAHQGQDIMKVLNAACKLSGKDTALRYQAGLWAGFDLAIGQLERAIAEAERSDENAKEQITADELLRKIRGENP